MSLILSWRTCPSETVKTSVLSRKWRYMWTAVPRLKFDPVFFENIPINEHLKKHEIPNVISEVLLQHNGPIHEFILCIPDDHPIRLRCLSQWILFLSKRRLKALKLVNWQLDPYEMPSHLFSCTDLIRLELDSFTLKPPPDFVGFKNLVQLHMFDVRIETPTLESLISSCPLLERLTISYCVGFDYLKISSPNLKVLMIDDDDGVLKSICFEGLNYLTYLKVQLERSMENFERGRMSNLVKIFSPMPKIKKLRLVNGSIQYLSAGSIPDMLPKMIYSLTHLKLCGIGLYEPREISLFCCLLKSFPNLEELEIRTEDRGQLLVWDDFLGLTNLLPCSASYSDY